VEEFFGQFSAVIDKKKRRITIPAEFVRLDLDGKVLFKITDNGCVGIFKPYEILLEEAPYVYGAYTDMQGRVVVPQGLENSVSFFNEPNIIFAGCKDHVEIWPGPTE
jgi:DNA-binding transcriptional regulator/RsmH inhibitor MraZ